MCFAAQDCFISEAVRDAGAELGKPDIVDCNPSPAC